MEYKYCEISEQSAVCITRMELVLSNPIWTREETSVDGRELE